jgi:hypothetical protein
VAEEYLETGADTRTPAGDNLLLGFARTEAAAYADLARCSGGAVVDDAALGLSLHDTGSASPFGNTASLTSPVPGDRVPELVAALRGFYGSRRGGPYIVFSPWPLDLSGHGFHLVGHPPLMVRPAAPHTLRGSELRIEAVHDVAQLDEAERVLVDGFPVEELQPWQPRCVLGTGALETPWRFWLGYEGDRAVATAATYTGEVSIVEQVAVLPEARGKGYGFDITAAATATDVPSMLISSDPGRPVYDRLGYLSLLRFTLWLGVR